jgi:putative iron-regulated protein
MPRPARLLCATALVLVLAAPAQAADPAAVVATYADLAAAGYGDSLTTAQALQTAVDALIATPSEETLTAARAAWLAARVPYQQTEVFRFGNPIVDDWEGRVNAWPLDEGLIDYVDSGAYGGPSEENPLSTLNVIATPKFSMARPRSTPRPSPPTRSAPCTRPTGSRRMSPRAITPSNSCSGVRI